jgi:hypothetical protein
MTFDNTGVLALTQQAPGDTAPAGAGTFRLVDKVSDLFELALGKYRAEFHRDPMGMMSFDVNGFLVTLNGYRFDPDIGQKIAAARAAGWMVMVSTANDLGSGRRYMEYMSVPESAVDIWNCGNGKNLYASRPNGGWLRHSNVPGEIRERFARMMRDIGRDIGELCTREGIEWRLSHPTRSAIERPSDGYRLIAGHDGEFGEDPRISFILQGWNEQGRFVDAAAIAHVGERILTDILPRYPDFELAGRPELDGANGFIYISGNGVHCAKATYIAAARDHFRQRLDGRFAVAHAGDNHNEYGCESAADWLLVPACADTRLIQRLEQEALPYNFRLVHSCPQAAGEYIERVIQLAANR